MDKLTRLAEPARTVWIAKPHSDHDSIEITEMNGFDAVEVLCTTPYKLPGMMVEALAKLERGRRAAYE